MHFLSQWGLTDKWRSEMSQALDQEDLDLSNNITHF